MEQSRTFEDYQGEEVKLLDEVWEDHISVDHPEMEILLIERILKTPHIVCLSQHANMMNYRQYYSKPWKNKKKRERYFRVVVKVCSDGNWISTAHTRSKISCGKVIYKEK